MFSQRFIMTGVLIGIFVPPSFAIESSKTAALVDKYAITAQERAACTGDAIVYCSETFPDEEKLLVCMKLHRASLSSECRVVFDQGIRRRRL